MEELAANGVAVLFVSSEMEEVLGMADRTLIMHEGAITGSCPATNLAKKRSCNWQPAIRLRHKSIMNKNTLGF